MMRKLDVSESTSTSQLSLLKDAVRWDVASLPQAVVGVVYTQKARDKLLCSLRPSWPPL
jgi:hypothetical protein